MKFKINIFLFIFFGLFYLVSCSNDVLNSALEKAFPISKEATNFNSTLGNAYIYLSWTNPDDSNFKEVAILKKTGSYPISYSDPSAVVIYQGTDSSYKDATVSLNTYYYYALYTINEKNNYSNNPQKTYKKVLAFYPEIRNRCFYLIGGSTSYTAPFDNLVSAIDAFDPVTSTVYPNVATLPTPRYGCAVASVSGKIFIFGGVDKNKNIVSSVDVLNVSSSTWPENIWSTATNMPFPRFSLRAENINNKIYVFGGTSGFFGYISAQGLLSNVLLLMSKKNYRYDEVSDIWSVNDEFIAQLVYENMNFSSGAYNGNIFYAGGRTNGNPALVTTGYIHNLAANYSVALPALPLLRGAASGIVYNKILADNSDLVIFFVIGGINDALASPATYEPMKTAAYAVTPTNTCYGIRFPNPNGALSWTTCWTTQPPSLPQARAYAEAEYYGEYIYLIGGIDNFGLPTNNIYRLNINNGNFLGINWDELSGIGLSTRYAYDITKVN